VNHDGVEILSCVPKLITVKVVSADVGGLATDASGTKQAGNVARLHRLFDIMTGQNDHEYLL
jgi:hypothetical protein